MSADIQEGGVVLEREQAQWVRKALVNGLSAFAELEKAIELIDYCEKHDMKPSEVPKDWHPVHPTGATAETMGDFATAMAVML